jgi:hypothetical protein
LVFADFLWEASEAKQEEPVCSAILDGDNGNMPKVGHSALER